MILSNYLAALWGITIFVVSLSLLVKQKVLGKLFAEMKNEAIMYFGGIFSLVVGIAMVLAHNVWVLNWQVIITILGWLSLLKGLDVLFLPKRMKTRWAKMEKKQWFIIFLSLLIFGLILIYFGFTA
ncbi:hypothetical protein COS64_04710 [archaeon CG06_land_8_20_14_3_00_37_11]|nr:MAG: hypothetical protein COS64_04710 [archaeon CG06_land_8_20_14_3_00_37_11]